MKCALKLCMVTEHCLTHTHVSLSSDADDVITVLNGKFNEIQSLSAIY